MSDKNCSVTGPDNCCGDPWNCQHPCGISVRIPAIGSFATGISNTCADAGLSETAFRESAAEYAHEEFCPSIYPGVSRFASWLEDQEAPEATEAEQFNHFASDHFEEIANRAERAVRVS